jgi:hypothetical protein
MEAGGDTTKPPIQVSTIVGAPAIIPSAIRYETLGFSFYHRSHYGQTFGRIMQRKAHYQKKALSATSPIPIASYGKIRIAMLAYVINVSLD